MHDGHNRDQPGVGKSLFRNFLYFVSIATCLFLVSGCEKSPPAKFRFNEVEWIKQERSVLSEGEHYDESFKTEIGSILTTLFGTPDDPSFPYILSEEAEDVISLANLKMAAGTVKSDKQGEPRGLYREHCAHCHGITGDGAGPTAQMLNPYPRDFRLSKFKFKSTPLGQPPTDHDLRTIMLNGIPGTAMPSFRTLPDEEIEALIHYVKYLTIRGQMERALIFEVELDRPPLIDMSLLDHTQEGEEPNEDDLEEFRDQVYGVIGDPFQEDIIPKWLNPDRKVSTVPPAPAMFQLSHQSHQQFVDEGRKLFFSKGNCMQCHGETGVGDGQLGIDAWTNDWIKSADILDPTSYEDFIAAGALPPRQIRPRNLHLPVYRGGNHPDDIYLRVANGIEGTPMPSSSVLSSDETWKIVAYVLSLPYEDSKSRDQKPVNEKGITR